MKNWLSHPAFAITVNLIAVAAVFGGMQVKLAEVSAQLTEIKISISKLEDKKEGYAERFASLESRVKSLEKYNNL